MIVPIIKITANVVAKTEWYTTLAEKPMAFKGALLVSILNFRKQFQPSRSVLPHQIIFIRCVSSFLP